MAEATPRFPAEQVGRQIGAVFRAWGMREDLIQPTVEVMLETDLRGIDSHGLSMLPPYALFRAEGKLNMTPDIRVVRDGPATAVIDGDSGLGHATSLRAVDLAVTKARSLGLGAVAVRNSMHFGAAGAYALRIAKAGFVGIATTNASSRSLVPTRARDKLLGTNPLAFAAPAARNRPFVLDMATTTVAVGKVKLAWLNGKPMPKGWVVDAAGRPETDGARAFGDSQRFSENHGLTPLGGLAEMSSHKGYGLAAMVEILSAMLSGATFIGLRGQKPNPPRGNDIGHFFLAIDPAAFRTDDGFGGDLDAMIDQLHALAPLDPSLPVLVPGDPENAATAERERLGIPVPDILLRQLRGVCREANAEFLLEG